MKHYVLADAARRDLFEIWDYLADHAGPEVADRVIDDLHDAICKLVQTPFIGHRREDLVNQAVRFWAVYSYFVIYQPDSSPLAIARVLHASRDIPTILETD